VLVSNIGIQMSAPFSRKKKGIKVKKGKVRMVVGQGCKYFRNIRGSRKSLVGCFNGKVVHLKTLKGWLKENWAEFWGYYLPFHVLARGWSCFLLHSMDDSEKILGKD
jgi:hypothetical protein